MLSKELNKLLTETGPDAPMGQFIRRYWVPALLSEEIPEPDCPPVQVRILGEELVAFRDSPGRGGPAGGPGPPRGPVVVSGRKGGGGAPLHLPGRKVGGRGPRARPARRARRQHLQGPPAPPVVPHARGGGHGVRLP